MKSPPKSLSLLLLSKILLLFFFSTANTTQCYFIELDSVVKLCASYHESEIISDLQQHGGYAYFYKYTTMVSSFNKQNKETISSYDPMRYSIECYNTQTKLSKGIECLVIDNINYKNETFTAGKLPISIYGLKRNGQEIRLPFVKEKGVYCVSQTPDVSKILVNIINKNQTKNLEIFLSEFIISIISSGISQSLINKRSKLTRESLNLITYFVLFSGVISGGFHIIFLEGQLSNMICGLGCFLLMIKVGNLNLADLKKSPFEHIRDQVPILRLGWFLISAILSLGYYRVKQLKFQYPIEFQCLGVVPPKHLWQLMSVYMPLTITLSFCIKALYEDLQDNKGVSTYPNLLNLFCIMLKPLIYIGLTIIVHVVQCDRDISLVDTFHNDLFVKFIDIIGILSTFIVTLIFIRWKDYYDENDLQTGAKKKKKKMQKEGEAKAKKK